MELDESPNIDDKKIDAFILNNKNRYDSITVFQKCLANLDSDTYIDAINFVKEHRDVFFKDHASYIVFFNIVITFSSINFLNLEIILDILIYFSKEKDSENIKATEDELLELAHTYLNSINYLYLKNFFSIETIIKKSNISALLFVDFLPEIEAEDKEYAEMKGGQISLISTEKTNDNLLKEFYKTVKTDFSKHIINRNLNYHPLPIHKSIREDDIDTFQLLLSQTNYGLNSLIEFSYYERSKTKDNELTPIKIASIYRSIKIFKFLLMNDAVLDENFMHYAFWSCNFEIIHLSESRSTVGDSILQPLYIHNEEIFEYFIENYEEKLEEKNDEVKDLLQKKFIEKVDDEDDPYKKLNYSLLVESVIAMNYPIVLCNLRKIVFLAKFYEFRETEYINENEESFLSGAIFDFDFFHFLISMSEGQINSKNRAFIDRLINDACEFNANDTFKFLFLTFYDQIDFYRLMPSLITNNHEMAIFVLDKLIEDKKLATNGKFFHLRKKIGYEVLKLSVLFYNEDIICRLFQLGIIFLSKEYFISFLALLCISTSSKTCLSLFKKLHPYLPKQILLPIAKVFEKKGKFKAVVDFLHEKAKTKEDAS